MRTDTRFARPERSEIEAKLPQKVLSSPEALGVWNMMLQSDDPSEVCRWYRSYRDSPHCTLARKDLRSMRDTMIMVMRESNKMEEKPRKEKRKGKHYPDYENIWVPEQRSGA